MASCFILAESGSTKTDWILSGKGIDPFVWQGPGINPETQKAEQVQSALEEMANRFEGLPFPSHIYYYGSGLGSPANRAQIRSGLESLFPGSQVEADHDLLAAARALAGDSPALIGILGTGTNACRYDGKRIVAEMGGHGHLFGDEGGGADLGKTLIYEALHGQLEPNLESLLLDRLGCTLLEFRKQAYQAQRPNLLLSPLTTFLAEHLEHAQVKALILGRFRAFLQATVLRLAPAGSLPLHVTGSVGWHFRDLLAQACAQEGIPLGRVLAAPAQALLQYHLTHL